MVMAEIATFINSQCHQCIYSNTKFDTEWIRSVEGIESYVEA